MNFSKSFATPAVDEPEFERLTGLLFALVIFFGLVAGCLVWPASAKADVIFVRDTITETGVTADEAQAANALIRSAVANRPGETLATNEAQSKIQLQPRLLKLGDVFLLTLEKTLNGEIVYVAQTKFPRITELDQASRRTVLTVLAEPLASYKKSGTPRYPSAPFSDPKLGASAQSANSPTSNSLASGAQAKRALPQDRPAQDLAASSSSGTASTSDSTSDSTSGSTSGSMSAGASPRASEGNSPNATTATDPAISPGQGGVAGASSDGKTDSAADAKPETELSRRRARNDAETAAAVNRSSRQVQDITSQFPERNPSRWLIGLGPVISRHMDADQVMYGLAGAFVWDLNPFLSTKVLLEANLSGGTDSGQYYNGAVGGNYYFVNRIENAPYVTADVGYGYASSAAAGMAEGFSLGLGGGYELLRTSSNPLDLSLRFSTIFSGMSKGYGDPSIYGARVSVSI